jgi:hypothetical protein
MVTTAESIEKLQTGNIALHAGAKVTYVEWLTKAGSRKAVSSLNMRLATRM